MDEEYPQNNTCNPIKIDKNILNWAIQLQEEYESYRTRATQEIREKLLESESKNTDPP
jgi:hypothetical protein